MLISSYQRLWLTERDSRFPLIVTILLLVICIGFPVVVGLFPYNPMISVVAIGVVAAVFGLILFFDLKSFVLFGLPFVFFFRHHHPVMIVTALLIVSFLAWRLLSGRIAFRIPFPILTAVIVLAGLNGVVRAINFDTGRFYYLYMVLVPLFVFIVFYNLQPSTSEIRANLGIVSAIAGLIGWVSLAQYIYTGIPRVVVTWGTTQQNLGAAFLSLLLPLALISMIDSFGKKSGWFWTWVFFGLLGGILASQTRAILFSIMFTMIYITWYERRALKVMIPIFLIALIALPTLIIYRMAMLFGVGAEIDWSSIGRIQIWLNSLSILPEYFWFGMGTDSYRILYSSRFPFTFINASHVHNVYLKWIFDYGVFAMISFILFIFGCWKQGHRALAGIKEKGWNSDTRTLFAINAGILSILISGMVDAFFNDTRIVLLFWIMLAYQLILSKRAASVKVSD